MGADGGSIPDRRDLVRTKAKSEQTDKTLLRELFLLCALSKKPLSRPVVLDPLGKLYNKDAVLEYYIDKSKYGDGEQICGYLKGLKDLLTLNVTPNPDYTAPSASTTADIPSRAPFVCPLSLREMSGSVPFTALRSCGCVFSDAAIRAIIPNLTRGVGAKANAATSSSKEDIPEEAKPVVANGEKDKTEGVNCPNCGKSFDPTAVNAIIPINPSREVQEVLLDHLLTTRASAKSSKKRKNLDKAAVDVNATGNGNGTGNGTTNSNRASPSSAALEPPSKAARTSSASASPAPSSTNAPSINPINGHGRGIARSVAEKLAEQERKRLKAQEGMSEAVKAMFKPKDGGPKKGGAEEFFGRTFTRYAA
ncbi:hypothetical protein I316_05280 [Kwoniella heveanensis BCC8398]|uniref:Uncharacterized protein n=1 Tax=Kwoniella heveanensis BCC8398 TaxID=1296120 RepID=A0A1B9GPK6_9TREE|nr:hypothetical protein I316_05280 [Kwoniella heveanensis BCC8398]